MPQWNCACPNCQAARAGRIRPRTQSCVAIGDGQGGWFLVNASPDLRSQIEANPYLRPRASGARNSPIASVLLTNADLDHVLGLFLLREGAPLHIYATQAVFSVLETTLGLTRVLNSMCGTVCHEPPMDKLKPLLSSGNKGAGLSYRAIELPGQPPRFAPGSSGPHSVAYEFRDEQTGGKLLVAPDVAGLNEPFSKALAQADAVLFDGTFWAGDELSAIKPGAPSAEEIGHMTIQKESLPLLAGLRARQRIYIHINNTNPVLALGSAERRQVEAAGVVVGYDGLEFEL
ncbi:MAG TPA: MBL fold metallo-hydrolase [Verrucomicrobiae bacterium]|nr:MBL fold metallo-hydrolase [Verrucomicrobiae bacterium]